MLPLFLVTKKKEKGKKKTLPNSPFLVSLAIQLPTEKWTARKGGKSLTELVIVCTSILRPTWFASKI